MLDSYALAQERGIANLDKAQMEARLRAWQEEVGDDQRRYFWLFERAADQMAKRIKEMRDELLRAERFAPEGRDARELPGKIRVLEADFEAAYLMAALMKQRSFEQDLDAFVRFMKASRGKKPREKR